MDEGRIIHHIRSERGITQEALANGICSVRHLRDIEKGVKEPSYRLLSQLTERLNVDIHLLVNEDVRKYGLELYKELQKVERLHFEWKFEALEGVLETLSSKYFFESSLLKKMKYYEAICQKENHNNYAATKQILLNAIGIMSLAEIDSYLKHYRDRIDLNIVNALAVNESYQGYMRSALNIFEHIRKHLIQFDGLASPFGIKVLYNIVKHLFDTGYYEEAIECAKEVLSNCKKMNQYRLVAQCYYYIAVSNKELKRTSESALYYKKYIYTRCLLNDYMKAQDTIKNVMSENDLNLDGEIVGELLLEEG